MPIVRHTLFVRNAPDGSADCVLNMYDQDDVSRGQVPFRTDTGPDVQTRAEATAAMHIEITNTWLMENEYNQIIGNEE